MVQGLWSFGPVTSLVWGLHLFELYHVAISLARRRAVLFVCLFGLGFLFV